MEWDGMGWELSWGPSQGFDGRVGNFRDGLMAFCRESHPLQFSANKSRDLSGTDPTNGDLSNRRRDCTSQRAGIYPTDRSDQISRNQPWLPWLSRLTHDLWIGSSFWILFMFLSAFGSESPFVWMCLCFVAFCFCLCFLYARSKLRPYFA